MKRFIWTKGVWQWDEKSQCLVLLERRGYEHDGPMALAMDNPIMEQTSIQVFNDDGTDETDSTSKAGVGVDIIDQALDENLLVRFLVKETAGFANANFKPQIQVRLNGGTYQDVTGSSTIARVFDSTKLIDGNDCTQRIGSGSFLSANAGQDDVDGTAGKNAINYVGNDEAEFVYCFQVRSADVNGGDNVEVRISDGQIDVYGDPEIKITIAGATELAAQGVIVMQ